MNGEKRTGEEGEQRVPGWVYLVLLIFLVVVLLGVESLLNWLLPSR